LIRTSTYLRQLLKVNVTIAYYHHNNFPYYEALEFLPEARHILESMLDYDVVGFQLASHKNKFIESTKKFLKITNEKSVNAGQILIYNNHHTFINNHTFGINTNMFFSYANDHKMSNILAELKVKYKDKIVFLGIDCLDYMKGIEMKFKAFDLFLQRNEHLKDKVVLVQVTLKCQQFLKEIIRYENEKLSKLITAINDKYENRNVIDYRDDPIEYEELTALYLLADVFVVSSLSEALPIQAFEFVFCQHRKKVPGVLIVSKFAGVSSILEMSKEFIINPMNEEEMVETFNRTILMKNTQKIDIQEKYFKIVNTFTMNNWFDNYYSLFEMNFSLL
jgi:trehalose-6-phosphate synthase